MATAAVVVSFVAAVVTWAGLLSRSAGDRVFTQSFFTWISVGGFQVKAAIMVDPLSMTMALFVTGVGALIHLYAIGYMRHDPGFPRFFVYLNLFAFSMLMLVLGNSFLVMFLGWEGVGACSYWLISFWFQRDRPPPAGKKAFVTNRIGDFGFMLAIFLVFQHTGSLQFEGKSAQLPLYLWLPDAMEGPTPVSALIHAATMVTAGVYLMCRINPLLALAPGAATTVAWIGAATALFAATIACAQDDIKRVLAYSTISQLGYMFLAVGCGAYVSGVFHMVTHAFFKALLFLGAGSVIHALHDEQNLKRMGGLRKLMPVTYGTFLVAWLAISGIPPFAGFWSKDDILLNAWDKSIALWAIGLVTAGLTAYYMSRQVFLAFYGDERWRHAAPAEAADAHLEGPGAPAPHAADGDPHESPWTMSGPLVVLAALAAAGGALNLPFVARRYQLLDSWLGPVFAERLHQVHRGTDFKIILAAAATAAAAAGIAGAWGWLSRAERPELEPVVLRRAWLYDEAVSAFVDGPGIAAAGFTADVVDHEIVDGAVDGVGTLVRAASTTLRRVQTGYVRNYALGVAAGAVLLLGYAVLWAGR